MFAPLMEREHILELHAGGFEIGSHSLTHADLSVLPENSAWEQISRSGILLEMLINSPVRSFAYPYGRLGPRVKQMITEAGYDIGCGVWTGPSAFGVDPYEIRRIPILNSTQRADFAIRLLTPFQLYSWSKWNVRKFIDRVSGNRVPARRRPAAGAKEPHPVLQIHEGGAL
jgi:peptidoglycan/xylan/chitin deacetylase (PgdA/CDA1 family)